ncbi:MAG: Maf family protein [Gammaproteobacteria bacterium]
MPAEFIYLASTSPRRKDLLRQIDVRFELLAPDVDEDAESLEALRPGESPTAYVKRVTLAKARAARDRLLRRDLPPAPVLVADTAVALGGQILGKPVDDDDARRMLALLAGRKHRVLTAVAVVRGTRTESRISVSRVWFARIAPVEIDRYVASGESRGKAGAYAIQGAVARFVRRIEGSHSSIMGLPLFETAQLLRDDGRALPAPP